MYSHAVSDRRRNENANLVMVMITLTQELLSVEFCSQITSNAAHVKHLRNIRTDLLRMRRFKDEKF